MMTPIRLIPICLAIVSPLLCAGSGYAQTPTVAPPIVPLAAPLAAKKPTNLLPDDLQGAMIFRNDSGSTPPPSAKWSKAIGKGAVLRVECFNAPKSPDHVDVSWKIREPMKNGDVVLARFYVRAEYAKQESGEAIFQFSALQRTPEYTRHTLLDLTATSDWKLIEIPFAAVRDADAGQCEIHLALGTIPQAVEIAGLEVLNFGNRAALGELPLTKLTYKGREANAAWRKAALERIEKTRTAPLQIRVLDVNGKPVPNARVEAKLTRPAFVWGTEVDPRFLLGDTPDAKKYQETLLQYFDMAVIGNSMKWRMWSGSTEKRTEALAAADWILQHDLLMRGHCLVWPGDKFSPFRIQAMPAPRAELPLLIKEYIRDIVTANRGSMISWDVVNEMVHEQDYFKYMPEAEAAEWFKTARECDPQTKLVLNEYGMLNGRKSPEMIAQFLALAGRLQKAGAPIDILGIQGHVGRQVRDPEAVLSDLDLLAKSGLELQITEFDINTPDEVLQADYTRDFLIALYSHPAATGFTQWGFWQRAHWKPDAAMFRADWSEKPGAKAFRDLVQGAWRTNVVAQTGGDGTVKTRGHLGVYEFTVTTGAKVTKQVRTLTKDGTILTIQVP